MKHLTSVVLIRHRRDSFLRLDSVAKVEVQADRLMFVKLEVLSCMSSGFDWVLGLIVFTFISSAISKEATRELKCSDCRRFYVFEELLT
jgi:hypothetical protein